MVHESQHESELTTARPLPNALLGAVPPNTTPCRGESRHPSGDPTAPATANTAEAQQAVLAHPPPAINWHDVH